MLKMKPANADIEKILQTSLPLQAQLRRPIDGNDPQEKLTNCLLFIPLFIYLECVNQNKGLLKRKDSILEMNKNPYKLISN